MASPATSTFWVHRAEGSVSATPDFSFWCAGRSRAIVAMRELFPPVPLLFRRPLSRVAAAACGAAAAPAPQPLREFQRVVVAADALPVTRAAAEELAHYAGHVAGHEARRGAARQVLQRCAGPDFLRRRRRRRARASADRSRRGRARSGRSTPSPPASCSRATMAGRRVVDVRRRREHARGLHVARRAPRRALVLAGRIRRARAGQSRGGDSRARRAPAAGVRDPLGVDRLSRLPHEDLSRGGAQMGAALAARLGALGGLRP